MNKLKVAYYLVCFLFTQTLFGDLNVSTSQNTSNGDTISAYEDFTSLGSNILVSIQTAGTWTSATGIADPLTFPTLPQTAINSSGKMVVIWLGNDVLTFTQSLYGSVYVSGSWLTSLLSDPSSEYVIGNHQVKISDTGVVVVTWAAYLFSTGTNEARGIYASTYGTWAPIITLP